MATTLVIGLFHESGHGRRVGSMSSGILRQARHQPSRHGWRRIFHRPFFDDESTIQYSFYPFNSPGGFGIDADNVIHVDNFQLEFIPPTISSR